MHTPCSHALEPSLSVATEPSHVRSSHASPACTFIRAELDAAWWQCVFELRPVQIVCMSPPCQPWSTAGKRSGLQVPEGLHASWHSIKLLWFCWKRCQASGPILISPNFLPSGRNVDTAVSCRSRCNCQRCPLLPGGASFSSSSMPLKMALLCQV